MRKLHQLEKDDAVAMIESQQIKVFSVEEGGALLDLDETVFRNGLSHGAKLNVTLIGLISDPSLPHAGIVKPPLEPSISSSTFQPDDIRKATNNYSKQNIVGKGGQATVYRGSLFGSMVAIKKYQNIDFTGMTREIEVLQKVRHPNVILLMGYCREENCIISEFMEGGSLADRLCDQPDSWSWADRYLVAREIVSATYFLHSFDILHRDLKPANVLFDRHGTAKVADMGFAKLSAATMTASLPAGTPGYIDPGFFLSGKTSKSMDVYSLGLIILQMCTHKAYIGDIHDILDNVPHGQKRNSTFGINLFKAALVASDSSMPSVEIATTLLEVGLQCVERDSKHRPTLEEVIGRLAREKVEFTYARGSSFETLSIELATSHKGQIEAGNNKKDTESSLSSIHSMDLTDLRGIAMKGNVEAQFLLGCRYQNSYTVKKNKEVVKWYDMAAKQGHKGATDALHSLFENRYLSLSKRSWFKGRDVAFIQEFASSGVPAAQFFLGECYNYGIGIILDKVTAVQWYSKAAEQGHNGAQYTLAKCYDNGWVVEKDMAIAIQWYTKSATQQHSEAQYKLGVCFSNGWGVEKDMAVAIQWYFKSAEQGHSEAQCDLAVCYSNGWGVEIDMAMAVQWYLKSAEQGYSVAQYNLAECYKDGSGVERDMAIAVQWYIKSAEQGYSTAQYTLAECYKDGSGVERDMVIAVQWYIKSAEQGYSAAQYRLAECYNDGCGVEQDMAIAVQWYAKSAEQHHSESQYRLAVCYSDGCEVEKDMAIAVQWFTKSAEQGHNKAQYSLAMCLSNGCGVAKDMATAVKWFTKSAEQGCSAAQYNLAVCYRHGWGVGKDMVIATQWYTKAAKLGHSAAQYRLAECYSDGWVVEKDMASAMQWYAKSADQGYSAAQYRLAECYSDGWGVEKDLVTAVQWYNKSAEQGNYEAQYSLAECYKYGWGVEIDLTLAMKWYTRAAERTSMLSQNDEML